MLDATTLMRWRANPAAFIETVLHDPETDQPFKLLDAERAFLAHAFRMDDGGKLLYPEQLYAAPKKSGKTGFAALHMLTTVLLFGGRFAEAYCLANDLEQASSRVYQAIRRIVECSPLLKREARVTADKIVFSGFGGATITTVANDYTGAAGANPTISCFDELWGYQTERSRRLWDEMVPPPTRQVACRLTVSYAGFTGESVLLEELYKRGMAQPEVGPSLRAGDGLLCFWSHLPVAPWQDERWLAEMRRSLRPNQYLRMIECRFVTSESSFVELSQWDRCVDPSIGHRPNDKALPIFLGVDASLKHDSTAVVATSWDAKAQCVRLVTHRIFQPTPEQPLDFEATIEAYILDLKQRFSVRKILYDPYQMASTAQRLTKLGLPLEEFPQSSGNLTLASQNLFDLIQSQNIVCYPDAAMRLAVSRAVAIETPRGWRITKTLATHKIDVVVALAMAAHAAVLYQNEGPDYLEFCKRFNGTADGDDAGSWQRYRTQMYILSGGQIR
jgi:phage terminase large subunit-like protein